MKRDEIVMLSTGTRQRDHPWLRNGAGNSCILACLLLFLSVLPCAGQTALEESSKPTVQKEELNVNWLYGAYVPKEAPLIALTPKQRLKLYARQSFTTPGIYLKTALFSVADQAANSPPAWGRGLQGYGYRVASRHGQFVIQNTISALGNAAFEYEPRYDRCRCSGFWPRMGHAVLRNFVTYNNTEKQFRPQIALYGAALAAGMASSTWKQSHDAWNEGGRGVITQAGFGILANWIGEFAPEIARVVRRDHHQSRNEMKGGKP